MKQLREQKQQTQNLRYKREEPLHKSHAEECQLTVEKQLKLNAI